MKRSRIGVVSTVLLVSAAASAQTSARGLSQATMEELTQMEVSINSVSRKDESLWRTPAAAYVISREEIAQSTASSIPELLRSVPGLQVAQISASTWAVSARGFNSAFANKLLVLVDGRTVYSEIYSGAHWDEIDLPLEDVERIEVIRGPGAVIWGSNAVNGVINIITRPARGVSSAVLSSRISRINETGMVQQGGTLGNHGQYREFFSFVDRRPLENASGVNAYDGENLYRVGTRIDWQKNRATSLSLLGGAYGATLHQQITPTVAPVFAIGGGENDSLLGEFGQVRLEHESDRSGYDVEAYVSSDLRDELTARARTLTEDLDLVNHLRATSRVDLVGGAELRLTQDSVTAPMRVFRQSGFSNYLVDGFVQSQVTLIPNQLTATFGSKVQMGTLAGFQVEPSVKLSWNIDRAQYTWVSISRSSVAPALQDRDLTLNLSLGTVEGLPVDGQLTGNPAFKPETVIAYETGYRRHLTDTLSLDLASFFNVNQRIQSLAVGDPTPVLGSQPSVQVPLLYGNGYSAMSQGLEASLDWHPVKQLQIRGNYTWLEAQVEQKQPGEVTIIDGFDSPRNTFAGLWRWNLASGWSCGGMLYRAGPLLYDSSSNASPSTPATGGQIRGFTRLDVDVVRRLGSRFQIAGGGTNLFSPRHQEFGGATTFLSPLYVPRSLHIRAGWSF